MIGWIENKWRGALCRFTTLVARGYLRAKGVPVGPGTRFAGIPIVTTTGKARIMIGANCSIVSRPDSTALGVSRPTILRCLTDTARLNVGDDCGLSGTVICAAADVTIGARCLFGADVTIVDTDFHPHEPENRRYAVPDWDRISSPVLIGDDVFVGTGSFILKGVTIGAGSIIAAGSVVTKDVPAMTIAAGNPARAIRTVGQKIGTGRTGAEPESSL